jgi:Autophagocytosis associated protein, active-site domain
VTTRRPESQQSNYIPTMAVWTPGDFEYAVRRLAQLFDSNENDLLWRNDNGCLVAKATRQANFQSRCRSVANVLPDRELLYQEPDLDEHSLLSTEDHILNDCDTVYVGSLNKIEWRFSIAYSYIWHVPVLYFNVQLPNGTACSRLEVLQMLHCFCCDPDVMSDTWEFVSSDEHPVTGFPSFFLHPCQSSHRLVVMNASTTCPTMRLWSWMSMILPTVGVLISPKVYTVIQAQIDNQNT